MEMLSNSEEATGDQSNRCRSYVAPWNTSGENDGQIAPIDYDNIFTVIAPKHDVMSTIPEECSPIFNRTVEKSGDTRNASVEFFPSEEMVGSILDYVGSQEDDSKSDTTDRKVQEECFLDTGGTAINDESNKDDKTRRNMRQSPQDTCAASINTVNILNRNDNISCVTCSSKNQMKAIIPSLRGNNATQNTVLSKSAANADKKRVGYAPCNVTVQYCKDWSCYSFTV